MQIRSIKVEASPVLDHWECKINVETLDDDGHWRRWTLLDDLVNLEDNEVKGLLDTITKAFDKHK